MSYIFYIDKSEDYSFNHLFTFRNVEAIRQVFVEHDKAVKSGEYVLQKPWLQLPSTEILFTPPDGKCARTPLGHIVQMDDVAENASSDKCAAPLPNGCQIKAADVVLCELCRKWYHRQCISATREAPAGDEAYLCPRHFSSKASLCFLLLLLLTNAWIIEKRNVGDKVIRVIVCGRLIYLFLYFSF